MPDRRIRKRSKLLREEQLVQISEMQFRGKTIREIATHFHLSQSQIKKDLKEIRQRVLPADANQRDLFRAKILHKNEFIQKELAEAWERSKEAKEIQIKEQIASESSGGVEGNANKPSHAASERRKASVRSEPQYGNPAFMSELGKCLDREARLLGVNDKAERQGGDKPVQIQFIEIAQSVAAASLNSAQPKTAAVETQPNPSTLEDKPTPQQSRRDDTLQIGNIKLIVECPQEKLQHDLAEFADECAQHQIVSIARERANKAKLKE